MSLHPIAHIGEIPDTFIVIDADGYPLGNCVPSESEAHEMARYLTNYTVYRLVFQRAGFYPYLQKV